MSVKITNLSPAPLWISLNSGGNMRLSPGQASGEIHDAEVAGNPKVTKLTQERVIVVRQVDERAVPAGLDARAASHEGEPEAAPIVSAVGALVEEPERASRPRAGRKSGPPS